MKKLIVINILALIMAGLLKDDRSYLGYVIYVTACFVVAGTVFFSPYIYVIKREGVILS